MSERTQSPWCRACDAPDVDLADQKGVIVGARERLTGNRTIICRVWGEGPMTDANARLIVEAPEMLAALKAVVLEAPWQDGAAIRLAREAIAKAEGAHT